MSVRARRKRGEAGLAGAEHLALAAQAQILLGDAEAVLGLAHHLEARLRRRPERPLVEQEAGRGALAAADAAAQLVQLGKPEALGVLDHHHGRLRHVDADLDDRRRDEDRGLAGGEARHRGVALARAELAVDEADGVAEHRAQLGEAVLGGGEVDDLRFRRPAGRSSRPGRRP